MILAGIAPMAVILIFFAFMKKNPERTIAQNAEYVENAAGQTAERIDEILDHGTADHCDDFQFIWTAAGGAV